MRWFAPQIHAWKSLPHWQSGKAIFTESGSKSSGYVFVLYCTIWHFDPFSPTPFFFLSACVCYISQLDQGNRVKTVVIFKPTDTICFILHLTLNTRSWLFCYALGKEAVGWAIVSVSTSFPVSSPQFILYWSQRSPGWEHRLPLEWREAPAFLIGQLTPIPTLSVFFRPQLLEASNLHFRVPGLFSQGLVLQTCMNTYYLTHLTPETSTCHIPVNIDLNLLSLVYHRQRRTLSS